MRCGSVSSGQSPIEPQYTTARIPAAINSRPLLAKAAKSGVPSSLHGVIRAGMHPRKTIDLSATRHPSFGHVRYLHPFRNFRCVLAARTGLSNLSLSRREC